MFFQLSDKKIYQKLGFSIDQEGILSRYLRESDSWKYHLQQTKSFIIESYTNKGYTSIAVLGSGWLLDLPMEDICRDFIDIYLIDIVHPTQVTHKYRKNPNIHFIEMDITGGVAKYVYNLLRKNSKSVSNDICSIENFTFQLPSKIDFVVSLNILNQLDILLVDALQQKIGLDSIDIEKFRTVIQSKHIEMLEQNNYCLISDWEKLSHNIKSGDNNLEQLIYCNPPHSKISKEWNWDFDSQGMYEDSAQITFKVRAYSK